MLYKPEDLSSGSQLLHKSRCTGNLQPQGWEQCHLNPRSSLASRVSQSVSSGTIESPCLKKKMVGRDRRRYLTTTFGFTHICAHVHTYLNTYTCIHHTLMHSHVHLHTKKHTYIQMHTPQKEVRVLWPPKLTLRHEDDSQDFLGMAQPRHTPFPKVTAQ